MASNGRETSRRWPEEVIHSTNELTPATSWRSGQE
jgi:hypothetical protein